MSFAEIADRRLLRSVSEALGQLTWDVDADGFQRMRVPPGADIDTLLRLLLRRGLEPALVNQLLDRFEDRPMERALIAWDIAAGSLLGGDDAALAERLRTELAPLKQIGTSTAVAVPRDRIGALIEAVTAGGPTTEPSLASVAALSEGDTAGIQAALELADKAALAHLPSLALAISQILWARLALPAALDRIVETALDYERFDSLVPMTEQDDRSVQRQTYFGLRVSLAQLDTASAANIIEQMTKYPAVADGSDPGLVAARAELDLLSDKPVDASSVTAIEAIAPYDSTWRYGARVRDELRIESSPQDAPSTIDGFLTSFGNDMRVWAQAGYHPEVRAELLALVSREIRYQSHDPDAWRALAVFLDDGSVIEAELQERSMTQLAAALA